MNIHSVFPSNYIKAADLQGRQIDVEIARVEMEDIGDDHKPVMYFVGKQKGLVLNKTNSNVICDLYGDETDAWNGRIITLFATKVDYQGKRVDAVRVMAPRAVQQVAVPPTRPAPTPAAPPASAVLVDDQIPF